MSDDDEKIEIECPTCGGLAFSLGDGEYESVVHEEAAEMPGEAGARGRLCDDDGIVRGGLFWQGVDYPCTGHAHSAGLHLTCSTPVHGAVSNNEAARAASDGSCAADVCRRCMCACDCCVDRVRAARAKGPAR